MVKKQKQTHRYRERNCGCQWGEESEEEQDRGRGLRGTNYCILKSYKDTLYNTGNIANIL